MSKKQQKKLKAKEIPTQRQLSKWQRQRKLNRIIVITAAVFLAGILGYVGHGYYNDAIKPFRETVIRVNDTSFNMGYYIDMLDAQTTGFQPNESYAQLVANQIVQAELMRQGANDLGIEVNKGEVDKKIKESKLPDSKVYRAIAASELLTEKLLDYFGSQLPDKMEQAYIQLMLVEGHEIANNVTSKLEAGGNFTALLEEFSCDPDIGGDLGWLPAELMPSIMADTIPDIKPDEIRSIYDNSVTKSVGHWLIKVTDNDEQKGIYAHAMLLSSEEEAKEIKAELDNGADFAQLAEKYSQHESKDKGGDLGWLKKGEKGSETFDATAFTLELNKVSPPVKDKLETQGGYWVVKILDKGERELNDTAKQGLKNKDFRDWFSVQSTTSTINSYLDGEKISWAIQKVLQGRI
ncbi:MAG: hypothetical protein COX52_07300 [Syntrophobacterales bacterium CG23_combo_of_CG06-09_8_20_14_all_48_27]|nr:MAG: hypothetical protein COX52_07300 [Syntrophobacterales bacterium CG23_combo_of_CG06-09_8_20_14_all_48_27]